MRKMEYIFINSIKMDRHPLNPSILSLIDYLKSGGTVPPIKVSRLVDGNFIIKDGRHRVTASKLLGRKTILATFGEGTLKAD